LVLKRSCGAGTRPKHKNEKKSINPEGEEDRAEVSAYVTQTRHFQHRNPDEKKKSLGEKGKKQSKNQSKKDRRETGGIKTYFNEHELRL